MLHPETVEANTLALIKQLSADPKFKDFYLAGGTALSLQIGHRRSVDIDLFSKKKFDSLAFGKHLTENYKLEKLQALSNTLFTNVNGVDVSLISLQYPFARRLVNTEGIRMASLQDIGAMKLKAMINSGARLKDYVDMHFLLRHHSFNEMIRAFAKKYPDSNPSLARNALLYHKDIDFSARIDMMGKKFYWPDIVKRLHQAVQQPNRVFEDVTLG